MHYPIRNPVPYRWLIRLAAPILLIGAWGLVANPHGSLAATETAASASAQDALHTDLLPNVTLTNQYGKTIAFAGLKGKPVLVGFIHTSCKGVCELMTAKMKTVADDLGTKTGAKVTMVSISTDPADDGPTELLAYAKKTGVDGDGFVFLTGKPKVVKRVLALYHVNQDEGDDEMTHVFDLFLIAPDGTEVQHYHGTDIPPMKVASDIRQTLAHK